MKRLVVIALLSVACVPRLSPTFPAVPSSTRVYELRNGYWFNGREFIEQTKYTVYGALTDRRPVPVDSVIDLQGGYVVPAFGEAHNHNAVPSDTGVSNRYLKDGIFYVKNPNNLVRDREKAVGVFNTPRSIDVVFANGGITGPGGHPLDLARRNIARGTWNSADAEGGFYFSVASRKDVDAKWPAILAGKPDFIKTYLLFSDEYAKRLQDSTTRGWRGLNPDLLSYIVAKAHAAKLRVATHVETAADFRAAVRAHVDEINHLPGFRPEGNEMTGYASLHRYRLTAEDALQATKNHVVVVTTVSEVLEIANDFAAKGGAETAIGNQVRKMLASNLRVLHDNGVKIVIGSDRYRTTSVPEVFALRTTKVFSDTALLRMWSMDTPREILPGRDIGSLEAGSEASFLVLDGNPLEDFEAVKKIRMRVKKGVILP